MCFGLILGCQTIGALSTRRTDAPSSEPIPAELFHHRIAGSGFLYEVETNPSTAVSPIACKEHIEVEIHS